MDAQGALDSLLGRLATVLVNEAQLLGGVRSDVEFIKDEMESMNGLIVHLTEANHRDHQVRAWMKQVLGLTRDCDGNVELYIQYLARAAPGDGSGLLGYLRRTFRLLRTVPARHRVATRIRELKIRARDVGDRRLRYGVTVPSAAAEQDDAVFVDVQNPPSPGDEDDGRRRAMLDVPDDEEARINKEVDRLIGWLSVEVATATATATGGGGRAPLRIFTILHNHVYSIYEDESRFTEVRIARGVYQHPYAVSLFSCKAWVWSYQGPGSMLQQILEQVEPLPAVQGDSQNTEEEQSGETSRDADDRKTTQLIKKLQGCLKGKRCLIALRIREKEECKYLISVLVDVVAHCSPGNAILIITLYPEVAKSYSDRFLEAHSLSSYFGNRANALITRFASDTDRAYTYYNGSRQQIVGEILKECYPSMFAMKMVLHLLYVNPNRSRKQLSKFRDILKAHGLSKKSVARQMVKFSYDDLPAKYRGCLLYLTIFPEDDHIRRRTVAKRWMSEGLIATRENHAEDEIDCCFDALFSWGLIHPVEISAAGKIRTYKVHPIVREVITRIARDINFNDTNLPPRLAHHLSIHNGIGLQESNSNMQVTSNDIVVFLPYLAKSSQWQLLKMLDLEGCKGLNKHHLKSICKILLLKYLSLRKTDVTELPKQIGKLQCLETLDIRQTAIRAFATKSVVLPMLKHLLAGQTDSGSNSDRFQDSFATVRLPSGILRMRNLEIVSHLEVSHNVDDLTGIGMLLHLRKLGLVILLGKKSCLDLLFQQIRKLHGCLRSLSIRFNQQTASEGTMPSPPEHLQSLNISGITGGLHLWIAGHDQLTKITLRETDLGEDALRVLGRLRALRCLRLLYKSYTESEIKFKEQEFSSLMSLIIEGTNITNITFDAGVAPKLETIVWSFAKLEAISGLIHLPMLKKLELNGDFDTTSVKREIERHLNRPDIKHNGQILPHEVEHMIAAASTA